MRALVQRVSRAAVTVDGRVTGRIGQGFVVFLGVTHGDTTKEADWVVTKVAGLRVFDDDAGKMNLSLADVGGELLVISQFTLYGDTRRGRRPSFTDAANTAIAEPLVDYFINSLREAGFTVATGVFGTHMDVEIHNSGPVTMWIER